MPIAISAFTGNKLDASGITNVSDLPRLTPSLSYETFANYAIIFIRGVGTDAFVPSVDLSVATYIDGVYFPFSFGLARTLGDVERVEVLKGPQGTLFGHNATGGAISIVTRDPTAGQWTGSIKATVGNYDEYDSRLFISGPLTSSLSMSAGILYNWKRDYYHFIQPSPWTQVEPYRDFGGNLKLKWAPNDYFDAKLWALYLASQGAGTVLLTNIQPSPLGTAAGVTKAPDYEANDNIFPFAKTGTGVGSLTVGVHPGTFDIKSISAYQRETENLDADFDGSSANLISFGNPDQKANIQRGNVFTEELQVLSNDNSPWAEHLKWIFGLYYLKSANGYNHLNFAVANLQDGLTGLGEGTLPVGSGLNTLISDITKVVGPVADPLLATNLFVIGHLRTRSESAYTQLAYTPINWVDITLGGRIERDARTVYDSALGIQATSLNVPVSSALLSYAPQSLAHVTFSPKVVLDFKPIDGVLLYTSWQRAYQSASFNIVNLTEAPTTIQSESVTTEEAGAKTQFFDRSVQLNAAYFQNHFRHLQSQFLSLLSGGIIQFQSVPLAHNSGFEVDAEWVIVPGLQLTAGASHLISRYDSFDNALGFNQQTGLFNSTNTYTGNRIVQNPSFTATSSLQYSRDVWRGNATLGVDYYFNSGFFYDPGNTISQNSYYLLGAHGSYLYQPANIELSLYGQNLTNEKYYLTKLQDDTGVFAKLASPRTYGVRLSWSF